jgi:hypothetical protein
VDYGTMLGRIMSRTASDDEAMRYELERDETSLKVIAQRDSGNAGIRPVAMLDSGGLSLDFNERAPGLFEAVLPASLREDVRIVAGVEGTGRNPRTRLVSTSIDAVHAETQVDPVEALDLERLSRATGGHVLEPGGKMPSVESSARSLGLAALWPWCLLLALLAYLAEITYRRWARS